VLKFQLIVHINVTHLPKFKISYVCFPLKADITLLSSFMSQVTWSLRSFRAETA